MKFIARLDGQDTPVEVERRGSGYVVTIGERTLLCDLVEAGPTLRSLRLEDGTQHALMIHHRERQFEVSMGDSQILVEIIDPLAVRRHSASNSASEESGVVKAPMPGRVVKVLVATGDSVKKGSSLIILEAMKMENEIVSTIDGTVERILVSAGDTVESGADLVHLS